MFQGRGKEFRRSIKKESYKTVKANSFVLVVGSCINTKLQFILISRMNAELDLSIDALPAGSLANSTMFYRDTNYRWCIGEKKLQLMLKRRWNNYNCMLPIYFLSVYMYDFVLAHKNSRVMHRVMMAKEVHISGWLEGWISLCNTCPYIKFVPCWDTLI